MTNNNSSPAADHDDVIEDIDLEFAGLSSDLDLDSDYDDDLDELNWHDGTVSGHRVY